MTGMISYITDHFIYIILLLSCNLSGFTFYCICLLLHRMFFVKHFLTVKKKGFENIGFIKRLAGELVVLHHKICLLS